MTIAVELAQGVYPDIDQTVSHETIYRAIYDHHHTDLPRDIFRCLHRRRRTRFHRGTRRSQPQTWRANLPHISQRPPVADERSEVGHLEGGLIIGAQWSSAIITVFDRKSRHLWMEPLRDGRSAPQTLKGLTVLVERIPPRLRRSLTWDQGSEMRLHEQLTASCGIDVFFADAHSPWQRPTNENGHRTDRQPSVDGDVMHPGVVGVASVTS